MVNVGITIAFYRRIDHDYKWFVHAGAGEDMPASSSLITLIESIGNDDVLWIRTMYSDEPTMNSIKGVNMRDSAWGLLYKMSEITDGATYNCPAYKNLSNHYIWLEKYVNSAFGGTFPQAIYFRY